jgi:co-chaperonin GroES (HSP10)
MKVIGKRALGKVLGELERVTKSGLILAGESQETATTKLFRAEIVANKLPDISVGDVVVYSRFNGTPFEHKGEKYVLLDEKDVLYAE